MLSLPPGGLLENLPRSSSRGSRRRPRRSRLSCFQPDGDCRVVQALRLSPLEMISSTLPPGHLTYSLETGDEQLKILEECIGIGQIGQMVGVIWAVSC